MKPNEWMYIVVDSKISNNQAVTKVAVRKAKALCKSPLINSNDVIGLVTWGECADLRGACFYKVRRMKELLSYYRKFAGWNKKQIAFFCDLKEEITVMNIEWIEANPDEVIAENNEESPLLL